MTIKAPGKLILLIIVCGTVTGSAFAQKRGKLETGDRDGALSRRRREM
jgi:hypothetical protein